MAYYECAGNLYEVDAYGNAHPLGVTAKDKVVEVRELESVTTKPGKENVELPDGARLISMNEIICKFNLSEKNPVKFDKEAHKAALEAATKADEEPEDDESEETEEVDGEEVEEQ